MSKEIISDSQGIKLVILYLFGSTLVMGTGGNAGRDAWLSMLAAAVLTVPVYLIYGRIISLFPGKDLMEILEMNFGKFFGNLISLAFIWFAFHLGALVMRNFGEFIVTVALPETPMVIPMVVYGLLCIWGVKAGIETLAKCGEYFIVFVFALLILYSLLAIHTMDVTNIYPIVGEGLLKAMSGTFPTFSYPFGEAVVFMMVFSALSKKTSSYKIYLWALLIAGISIAYITLRNIMILGPYTLKSVYFPAYIAIRRINIGNFLQRIEIGVTIVFLLCGFIKIAICLLAASKGLSRIFGFRDYRLLVTPVGLLMINLSYTIYRNIMETYQWAFDIWPYYAFPFQVILPLFIWVFIEVKEKMKNRPPERDEALEDGGGA
jgi:spore germination protein KB